MFESKQGVDIAEETLARVGVSPPTGRVVLLSLIGSRAYGTSRDDSDYDMRGVFRAPTAQVLSLYTPPARSARFSDRDVTLFELGHFVALAADANPAALEVLWAPDADLAHLPGATAPLIVEHPAGQVLRANRQLFLSRLVLNTYCGYAASQMQRARGSTPGPHREKCLLHMFRGLELGASLLRAGDMTLRVADPDALREQARLPLAKAEELSGVLMEKIGRNVKHSPLPERPDLDAIDRLLLKLRLAELDERRNLDTFGSR